MSRGSRNYFGLKSEKGFSLIEIMVAFAILGVGMLGVGTMLIASMEQDKYTSKMQNADQLAMNLAEELRADSVDGVVATTQDIHGKSYYYKIWVTKDEPTLGIDRVDVWIGCDGPNCNQTNPLECKYTTTITNFLVQ